MTILEFYTDQQCELINGGHRYRRHRQFHDMENILQDRFKDLGGKIKMKITQINSIIDSVSMHH